MSGAPLRVVRDDWDGGEASERLVRDLTGDWDTSRPVTAAAEAEAAPEDAGNDPQRARVHPCTRARARDSIALLPVWGAAVWEEISASLRASASHGAPWEEQPVSVVQLREQVMRKAHQHDAFPPLRMLYILWGHLFTIPVSALGYGLLWAVIQSPGRTLLTLILWTVLSATGVLPPQFRL